MMYSSNDVLEELGWSDLRTPRAKHEVTQMLKMSTGEAPFFVGTGQKVQGGSISKCGG